MASFLGLFSVALHQQLSCLSYVCLGAACLNATAVRRYWYGELVVATNYSNDPISDLRVMAFEIGLKVLLHRPLLAFGFHDHLLVVVAT